MRAAVLSAAVLFSIAGSVFAQEYVEFKSEQDRFSIVFPAQPKITETPYTSEFKSVLPSRIYSVDQGQSHFKVTVVDYNNIRAIATEAKVDPALVHHYFGTKEKLFLRVPGLENEPTSLVPPSLRRRRQSRVLPERRRAGGPRRMPVRRARVTGSLTSKAPSSTRPGS